MEVTVDLTNLIIALVALYGAILSTYNIIRQHRLSVPRVQVELVLGFIADPVSGVSDSMIFIKAANVGQVPVSLSGHAFRLPDKRQLIIQLPSSSVRFPCELEPGKSCEIWIEMAKLVKEIRGQGFKGTVKISGEYKSETGKLFRSKKMKVDLNSWKS